MRCVVFLLLVVGASAGLQPNFDAYLHETTGTKPSKAKEHTLRKMLTQELVDSTSVVHVEAHLGVPSHLKAPTKQATRTNLQPQDHLRQYAHIYKLNPDTMYLKRWHNHTDGLSIAKFGQKVNGKEVFHNTLNIVMQGQRNSLRGITGFASPHVQHQSQVQALAKHPHANLQAGVRNSLLEALADVLGAHLSKLNIILTDTKDDYFYFAVNPEVPNEIFGQQATEAPVLRGRAVYYNLVDKLVPAYQTDIVGQLQSGEPFAYVHVFEAAVEKKEKKRLLFRKSLIEKFTTKFDVVTNAPQGANVADSVPAPKPDFTRDTLSGVVYDSSDFQGKDWLLATDTSTKSNNVWAFVGDSQETPNLTGDVFLDHPDQNTPEGRKAAAVNGWYVGNWLHDSWSAAGFDESKGAPTGDDPLRVHIMTDTPFNKWIENESDGTEWSPVRRWHGPAWVAVPPDGVSPTINLGSLTYKRLFAVSTNGDSTIAASEGWGVGLRVFNDSVNAPPADEVWHVAQPTCDTLAAIGQKDMVLWDDTVQPSESTCVTDAINSNADFSNKWVLMGLGSNSECTTQKIVKVMNSGAAGIILPSPSHCDTPSLNAWNWQATSSVPNFPGAFPLTIDYSKVDELTVDPSTVRLATLNCGDWSALVAKVGGSTGAVSLQFKCSYTRQLGFDNEVVAHEWGHVLVNRLVGNGAGMMTPQAQAISEGTADVVALLLHAVNADSLLQLSKPVSLGTWVTAKPEGIQRIPYSTQSNVNSLTYRHVVPGTPLPVSNNPAWGGDGADNALPHAAGEVWGNMLWSIAVSYCTKRVNLGDSIASGVAEFQSLLVDALMTMPENPTFTEARDAILMHVKSDDFDGIARAFSNRGLGPKAAAPMKWDPQFNGIEEDYSEFVGSDGLRYSLDSVTSTAVASTDCNGDINGLVPGEMTDLKLTITRRAGSLDASVTHVTVWAEPQGVMVAYPASTASTFAPYVQIPIESQSGDDPVYQYTVRVNVMVNTPFFTLMVKTPKTSVFKPEWMGYDTHEWTTWFSLPVSEIQSSAPPSPRSIGWAVDRNEAENPDNWKFVPDANAFVIMPETHQKSYVLWGPSLPATDDASPGDLHIIIEHKYSLGAGSHRWDNDIGFIELFLDNTVTNIDNNNWYTSNGPNKSSKDAGLTLRKVFAASQSPGYPEFSAIQLTIPRASTRTTDYRLVFTFQANDYASPDTQSHQMWMIRSMSYYWGDNKDGTIAKPAQTSGSLCTPATCECVVENSVVGCDSRMDGMCHANCKPGWMGGKCDQEQPDHIVNFMGMPKPEGWLGIDGNMDGNTWWLTDRGVAVKPGAGSKGDWVWTKPVQIRKKTSQLQFDVMSYTSQVFREVTATTVLQTVISKEGPYIGDESEREVVHEWTVSTKMQSVTVDLARWYRETVWIGWRYTDSARYDTGGAVIPAFTVKEGTLDEDSDKRIPLTQCVHGIPSGMSSGSCVEGGCRDAAFMGPNCDMPNDQLLQDFACRFEDSLEGWAMWSNDVYGGWDINCDAGMAISSINPFEASNRDNFAGSPAWRYLVTPPIKLSSSPMLRYLITAPHGFVAPNSVTIWVSTQGPYVDTLANTAEKIAAIKTCGPQDNKCEWQGHINLAAHGYNVDDIVWVAIKHEASTQEMISVDYLDVTGELTEARKPLTDCKYGKPTQNSDLKCVVGTCDLEFKGEYCDEHQFTAHSEVLVQPVLSVLSGTAEFTDVEVEGWRKVVSNVIGLEKHQVMVVDVIDNSGSHLGGGSNLKGIWWRLINISTGAGAQRRYTDNWILRSSQIGGQVNTHLPGWTWVSEADTATTALLRSNDNDFAGYTLVGIADPKPLARPPWRDFWPKRTNVGAPTNITFTGLWFSNNNVEVWAKLANRKAAGMSCQGVAPGGDATMLNQQKMVTFTPKATGIYSVCIRYRTDWVRLESAFLSSEVIDEERKRLPLWGYSTCQAYLETDEAKAAKICGCHFWSPYATHTRFAPKPENADTIYNVDSKWNVVQGCCKFGTATKHLTQGFEDNEDVKWGLCAGKPVAIV